MKLQIINKHGAVVAQSEGAQRLTLVHKPRYRKGDKIVFSCAQPGFYRLRLDDAIEPALVYVEREFTFAIPFGTMPRVCYSPRAFKGVMHLLSAEAAEPEQVAARRNLALNPLDQHGTTGMWPHATANIETRGEALFAARNAIDGIAAPHGHYPYPHQSWGINKDPNAALTIEFGVPVVVDTLILTLRADYPHDSHWTKGTVVFSDGSRETLHFEGSDQPQTFAIAPRKVTSLTLQELIKAPDESPYPALTQLEAWGRIAKEGV